jgi:AcrR family transcriptional regulator
MEPRPTETPAERRRQQQREDARRAILDATEALLVGDGYERFSMRRLADRCGYTAPTIYHYFGDKRGLLDTVLDERFQRVLSRIREIPRGGDPVQSLRQMLEVFARFGIENPTHYRLLTAPRPENSPDPESAEALRAALEQRIGELHAAGRLETDDIEEAFQVIWVVIHGLISLRINLPDYEWKERLLEHSLDLLLRGLLRRGTAAVSGGGPRRVGSAS